MVVDHFSVHARWYGCARVGVDVPVRKVSVAAHASLVDIVPHATFASIDCLADSPHVVVVGVVTNADVGTRSDDTSIAWALADLSDKVSSIHE